MFFGTFRGGFFGTNENASGNQCLARHWGSDAQSWWSMPFHCRAAGKHRVRIRYACSHRASVRVRIRRGERVVLETAPIELARSGPDWNAWAWGDVPTPALEPGVYRIELFEPSGSPDLDVVALAR